MQRDRLEDLGRVLERSARLLEHDIFNDKYWKRPKDAIDWMREQTQDKRDDAIHDIAYALQTLNEEIAAIWSIASGQTEGFER